MRQTKRHTLRIVLAVILLAALCIGGMELIVCRLAAPELYAEITAPVKQQIADQRDRLLEFNQNFFDNITLAAENITQQTASIARAVEEAQLPPAEDDLPLPPAPLAGDPSITSLIEIDGQYYLTGTEPQVVYYNQKDEPWASQNYGTDPIAGYGCGPTALAMVVSTFREENVNPAEMAQFCADCGYWASRQGSYLSIVAGVAESYSISYSGVTPENYDRENLIARLSGDELGIALMRKGHFTSSGHFIVLRGVTADGKILVSDPASLERSLTPWDLDLIMSELSYSRSAGAPLWLLSYNKAE